MTNYTYITEYGFGSKLSTEGDVYSLGIIILEILTGKRPTDEMFTEGLNLHKYVENAFPQKIVEVLDPCVVPSSEDGDADNILGHGNNATEGWKAASCIWLNSVFCALWRHQMIDQQYRMFMLKPSQSKKPLHCYMVEQKYCCFCCSHTSRA